MAINRNLSILAQGAGSNQTLTLTNAQANALTVGRQGATNPVLNVDASTASVVTGLNMKGAAAAGGMAVSVTSSGTNENLTIDAKGSGTVTLNATATGSVLVNRLLDISASTAGQIKFPATQNASSDANTLDDYEEGTWTPSLLFGGNNAGMTNVNSGSTYTKIGRNVSIVLGAGASVVGSSTGNAVFAGLPFTVLSTLTYVGMRFVATDPATGQSGSALAFGNTTNVNLYSDAVAAWTNANFNTSTRVFLNFSYPTAT